MSRITTSREKVSGDTFRLTTLDLDPNDGDPPDGSKNSSDSDKASKYES